MAFYYSKWLSLPIMVRHELANTFDIRKTGPTHVDTNRIVSDGYSIEAVESVLTPDNLRKFLNTDEKDEDVLFSMLLTKEEIIAEEPVSQEKAPETAPEAPVEAPKEPEAGTLEASNAKPEKIVVKTEEKPKKAVKKTTKK